MKFSENGKHEIKLLGIMEKGKWEFGEENELILTMKDGNKKVWNVISISERKMILVKGITNEKWFFETE